MKIMVQETPERRRRGLRYQAVNDALISYVDMAGATTAAAVRNRLKEVADLCDMLDSIVKHPDVWNVAFSDIVSDELAQQYDVAVRLLQLTDAPAIAWPRGVTARFTLILRREASNGQ